MSRHYRPGIYYGGNPVPPAPVYPTQPGTPLPIVTAPVKVSNPTISSATLNVGAVATAVHGTYTGTVSSYASQWYRGVSPIALATGLTYTYTTNDLGFNITYQETASNIHGSATLGISNSLGPISNSSALTTPTVTNISALGTAPLVLSLTDGDYTAGAYFEWEFAGSLTPAKNGDGSYTTPTQHGVAFVDGDSWARLDLALGYNTPSGPFAFNIRELRDNSTTGTVTVTDQLGNTFLADASGWSLDYTDTISASSATLTAAAGTSCSHLLTVTGGNLTWTVNSGGAEIYSRATIPAANTDFYAEMTVGTIAGGGHTVIGVTDASIDFNGGGAGFFGGGSALPGDATFNGFSLVIDGSIWVAYHANGAVNTFNIPSGANGTAGDVIGLRYNSSTKLFTVYYKHAATAMVSIGSLTLTSFIPATPYIFSGGKNTNDSGTVDFGATTYILAGPGTQGSPSGSNIYG